MTNKLTITTNTSLDGCRIRVQRINNQDYLCLTDLAGYTKKPHKVKIIQQCNPPAVDCNKLCVCNGLD